jgi:hypothetical protein
MTPRKLTLQWLGALMALLAPLTISAQQEQEKKSAKQEASSSAGKSALPAKAISTEQTFNSFGQMIPMGTRNKKVRIPSFEQGKQTSLITADAMTRVSDTELLAEEMEIQNFAEDPKENLLVKLHTATYDLQKKTLSSNQRSRVERADFSIEGDSMVYDTTNSTGRMVGRVVMIIKDAAALNGNSKTPAKKATTTTPTSSAAAPAGKAEATKPKESSRP